MMRMKRNRPFILVYKKLALTLPIQTNAVVDWANYNLTFSPSSSGACSDTQVGPQNINV